MNGCNYVSVSKINIVGVHIGLAEALLSVGQDFLKGNIDGRQLGGLIGHEVDAHYN